LELPIINGKKLNLPIFPLSLGHPEIGEKATAFGYSKVQSAASTDALHWQQSFHASNGKILEIHPNGRDCAMMNFPCFRTDSRYDAGMSGGPLLGSIQKGVIGLVSSAMAPYEEHGSWNSYAALLEPLLEFKAPITVNGESTVLTIREMAEQGIVTIR
jgi:hypothetical protein